MMWLIVLLVILGIIGYISESDSVTGKIIVFSVICGIVFSVLAFIALPEMFSLLAKVAFVVAGISLLVSIGMKFFGSSL